MARALLLTLALALAACQSGDAPAPAADSGADSALDAPADAMTPDVDADIVPVNLNTTPEADFVMLPGVGERMAHEFEEYRPYASIREFRQEIGKYVDAEQVAAYEPYVFVPVDPNASDAETLQQLPGVGPAEASALADGRPYADADAFLARVADLTGGHLEAARLYLGE